ncbi:hypothetical protein Mboo_1910 [Methanoregula boonei 6A8]|jgi:hypothetical protein|uniref:Uncharacterized protein n=1 Tax=Methanoregula boonei (strain DSM 21154 / JCM 14090 / 6A8) TaxID=456442 RepID=A7I9L4_METB6|nr:hypothetical protein [Methanoregula boonei]ABS56425.1 hypothetical protein Mboo_1910 [Methanoregula boonei 6A8]
MPDLPSLRIILLLAGGLLILCIAAWFLAGKRRRGVKRLASAISLDPNRSPLRVQKVPFRSTEDPANPDKITDATSHKEETDCVNKQRDLAGSLDALAKKYSLDEIILATADGLLLASSRNAPPAGDIARYTGMFAENIQPRPPGIILFGLEYKGSHLVGIARGRDLLIQEPDPDMVRETKAILNRWI